MTSTEAKETADNVNQHNIDRADADLDHVLIEIQEAAKKGDYGLDYSFVPEKDYSLVNQIRNSLSGLGYEVEIKKETENGQDFYTLEIDWSKE